MQHPSVIIKEKKKLFLSFTSLIYYMPCHSFITVAAFDIVVVGAAVVVL